MPESNDNNAITSDIVVNIQPTMLLAIGTIDMPIGKTEIEILDVTTNHNIILRLDNENIDILIETLVDARADSMQKRVASSQSVFI